jgi:Permuted papain-like amidase enzyme, YaeF/YiiX, C92 family
MVMNALAFFILLLTLPSAALAQEKSAPAAVAQNYTWQEGDLLFQSLNRVPLVDAIEGSTRSPWSHCGILHRTPGGWVVIEAIGPVRQTKLVDWVNQARDQSFAAYRLNATLQPRIPAIIAEAKKFYGRPYDIRYDLDDTKIYCSELLYKACLNATGEKLGQLQKLGELNWRPYENLIKAIENGPVPVERVMITPRSLSEASQLTKVYRHPTGARLPVQN